MGNNKELVELKQEVEKVERPYAVMLYGTINTFEWASEFDVSGLKPIHAISLDMRYEDSEEVDYIECAIYINDENIVHSVISCSTEINMQHMNHIMHSVMSVLRTDLDTNYEIAKTKYSIEEYESMLYFIDCIGMIHAYTNLINQ